MNESIKKRITLLLIFLFTLSLHVAVHAEGTQGLQQNLLPFRNLPATKPPLEKVLIRRGMRTAEVRFIQEKLREFGFYRGEVDGIFGPLTERAVRRFQQERNLLVDGIVGPKTFAELLRSSEGNGVVCPEYYEPVCGELFPPCREGESCSPIQKTYSNTCFAKRVGARILHRGSCEEVKQVEERIPISFPTVCTMEYTPVCAELSVSCEKGLCTIEKTFPNRCHAARAGARILHRGECSVQNPQRGFFRSLFENFLPALQKKP